MAKRTRTLASNGDPRRTPTRKPVSVSKANEPRKESFLASDFHSLGVRDLLDARDQFHTHLAKKRNVFSTAVGRFLVRESDPDAKRQDADHERPRISAPRTLWNASVKPWSWPCILVFVKQWQTLADLASKPDEVVPPFVYMPDGRTVPVCVVLAESAELPARTVDPARLASRSVGPGCPIFVDAQGQRRAGTIACLVSNGGDFYALTNAHLAGEAGRSVRALLRGVPEVVGTTEGTHHLTERTFSDIYPTLAGRDSVVNIDAATVRLDDVTRWDAKLLPGPLGEVADFSADTASLAWIGQPVVAQGGASGEMQGEIKALFYRYKSVGGRDYVADLVIGSRAGAETSLATQPGDSGALWCMDGVIAPGVRSPLALEWGGQRVHSGPAAGKLLQFSLATALSVILRELCLDVVHDPADERVEYWGPVGHFKIGQQACFLIRDEALRQLFTANIDRLSFSSDAQLKLATHLQASSFVPLSDVPDVVWKTNINRVKKSVTRSMENWNHYADVDLPGADGKTLLDLYRENPQSLNYSDWEDFYKQAPLPQASTSKSNSHGALPFRVWQIFSHLVDYAQRGKADLFFAAAGCLAHYVGDACQPLHSSQHADGLNGASTGVHSTYEDNMVDKYADPIAAGISDAIENLSFKPRRISSPRDAAMAAMDLMAFAHQTLPPETICNVYNEARSGTHTSATKDEAVLQALWQACGQPTIEVIAAGAVTLAALWDAAGAGAAAGWRNLPAFAKEDLMKIYEDPKFLPSLHLQYLGQSELPGSDAPKNPPQPPAHGGTASGQDKDTAAHDRGHRPKRARVARS